MASQKTNQASKRSNKKPQRKPIESLKFTKPVVHDEEPIVISPLDPSVPVTQLDYNHVKVKIEAEEQGNFNIPSVFPSPSLSPVSKSFPVDSPKPYIKKEPKDESSIKVKIEPKDDEDFPASQVKEEFDDEFNLTPVKREREDEDIESLSKRYKLERVVKQVRFSDEVTYIEPVFKPSKTVRFSHEVTIIEPESRSNTKVRFSDDVIYIEPEYFPPVEELIYTVIGEANQQFQFDFLESCKSIPCAPVKDEFDVFESYQERSDSKPGSEMEGWWNFSLRYCVDGDIDPELIPFLEDETRYLQDEYMRDESHDDEDDDNEYENEYDNE